MHDERSPNWEALREKQRGLIAEIRSRYPDAEVSEGEYVEPTGDGWRTIPVVTVEFPNGDQVTFFAEKPSHPTA